MFAKWKKEYSVIFKNLHKSPEKFKGHLQQLYLGGEIMSVFNFVLFAYLYFPICIR